MVDPTPIQGRPVLRSFFVPAGSATGTFRAQVAQWLGVAPAAAGALLLALCVEAPGPTAAPSSLVNAQGQRLSPSPAGGEPLWTFSVVGDGQMPPQGDLAAEPQFLPQYVGAIGVQMGPGGPVGGLFFFVQQMQEAR